MGTTTVIALSIFFIAILLSSSTALNSSYDQGPVKVSERASLWYTTKNDTFEFALAVNLSEQKALWLGIGLAAPGSLGMRGADLFSAHFPEGSDRCMGGGVDRHAPFRPFPRGDNGSYLAPQDNANDQIWKLKSCRRKNKNVTLEVIRSRNITNFDEDVDVLPGVTHVLHAFGEGHFLYHDTKNRGSTPLVLVKQNGTGTPARPTPTPIPSDGKQQFTFTSGAYEVTGSNLTCFTTLANVPNNATVVAITSRVNSKSVVRVIVYGCNDTPFFKDDGKVTRQCSMPMYSSGVKQEAKCTTMFYSWAPGVGELVFPPEAGITLNSGNQRLIMEVTFDRILGTYQENDVSITFHYSMKPRPNEVGSLLLGSPTYPWASVRVQNTTVDCPQGCTEYWKKPINIFAMHMHMGKYGSSMRLHRIDPTIDPAKPLVDSEITRATVDYWAPHFEQLHIFNDPVVVQPGQELKLFCEVRPDPTRDIIYGRNAAFEQCEAFAHYWPAQYRNDPNDGTLFYCSEEADEDGLSATLCGAGWRKDRLLTKKQSNVCFPAQAKVQLRDGRIIAMENLKVGDEVLVSSGIYSTVYMFSHQHSEAIHPFVELEFSESKNKFAASPGHLLYVNRVLSQADSIRPGDFVEDALGNPLRVNSVSLQHRSGLFNPQTVHGDIIVDGVRASTYTNSVDVSFAHALLAPFRSLFYASYFDIGTSLVCGSGRSPSFRTFYEMVRRKF